MSFNKAIAAEAAESFARNTATHKVTVLRSDGLYRHIHCRSAQGGSAYSWSVVTWPGHLAVTGDMGEWLFARLADMFEFFRRPDGKFDAQYWAEKCRAADKSTGLTTFDADYFRSVVDDHHRAWLESNQDNDRKWRPSGRYVTAAEDMNDIVANLKSTADDGEYVALTALRDCEEIHFDVGDYNFRTPSFRFLWICHAIIWTIARVDAGEFETAVPQCTR